jgi:hypothetical protein
MKSKKRTGPHLKSACGYIIPVRDNPEELKTYALFAQSAENNVEFFETGEYDTKDVHRLYVDQNSGVSQVDCKFVETVDGTRFPMLSPDTFLDEDTLAVHQLLKQKTVIIGWVNVEKLG